MNKKKTGAIVLCLIIGWLATLSTDWQSDLLGRTVMGGPMVALLVSMIACNLLPGLPKDFKAGTTFASKKFLNWGIILTGPNRKKNKKTGGPPRLFGGEPLCMLRLTTHQHVPSNATCDPGKIIVPQLLKIAGKSVIITKLDCIH